MKAEYIPVLRGITTGQAAAMVESIERVIDEDYVIRVTVPADEDEDGGATRNLWIGYKGTPGMAGQRVANVLAQALLCATGAA